MMTQRFQFITGLKATLCVSVLLRVRGCVCDLKLLLMQ